MDGHTVTIMLDRIAAGDRQAAEDLLPLVYEELRAMAGANMHRQSPAHTLQPTALVHELYLKVTSADPAFTNRAHFMAVAATAMRQILTDHARRKRAAKRGGDSGSRLDLDPGELPAATAALDAVALDDALTALHALDPRRHRVVELRFFGGLTVEETADLLGVSRSTVEADWRSARAWLAAELGA